ncbi:MAG: DUF3494 domain-containing protein [Burkholderiales bacterium]|nr:DUF3494 domain-containing protein [Bacteroidia bacterium]
MKINLLFALATVSLLSPTINYSQAPALGTAANFALFSTNGAVTNMGISQVTGNVGTNSGSSTGFGNVNGVMNDGNGASVQCSTDVALAYNQLNGTTPTGSLASLMGNGQTLTAGVYQIAGGATLNLELKLDGQNNPNAVFIFQVQGAMSAGPSAKVKLINDAKACNVFWKVEGVVSLAAGVSMKGTIIANNSAININTGDTLEGRAFSIIGAVNTNGVLVYTPVGCGSPTLNGPTAPVLGAAACYAVFSGNGAVSNSGITYLTGDVGTNVGSTTGFNPLFVNGNVHPIPDGSTAQAAADLLVAHTYLGTLSHDIELLYPAQFGKNLVLTPHTYLLNAATVFTDSLYLDAQGNPNAVFVMKINGAFTTSTYSKVKLINGTQAKNVYWKIEGAVAINDYSVFKGTIVCNNGALGAIGTGVKIDGRALTTNGALSITASTITAQSVPNNCASVGIKDLVGNNEGLSVFPNPFTSMVTIVMSNVSQDLKTEFKMYDLVGKEVYSKTLTQQSTQMEVTGLEKGLYFYKIFKANVLSQSGKLIAD